LAKRVFELARELSVTSKIVLEKCRAEGLEIKNHMSTLSAGLEATVREWFSDMPGGGTAVETAEHVDLERARKQAKKQRRKKVEDKKPPEPPTEAAEEPQPQAVAEKAVAEAASQPEGAVAPAAEPAGQAPDTEETPKPAKPKKVAKKSAKKTRKRAPEPEEVKPAGPQVVPKPAVLKGPRVVRVEKPDLMLGARPRRAGPVAAPSREPDTAPRPKRGKGERPEQESPAAASRRRTRRRSPRRRGGRAGESGEGLKEWRNQDLLERSERLAAAGGGLRRHRASVSRRKTEFAPSTKVGRIEIDEPITVKSLSAATGVKVAEIIKRLMGLGMAATINQVLDADTAETAMADYDIELIVKAAKGPDQELIEALAAREIGELSPRPPVVTFLGHVDHGKTSLMDRIRNTAVTEQEAGGITQHIGAYRLRREGTDVVFLDTPGHEAFTAMRARGANMTDVVVLVVAADDGVMPQTVEAISHARAAGVPIVVALNKIDLPNANVQRALGQLAENGLQPRQWGGDVEVIETSAVTGEGVEELVELLSLEAELLELTAEKDAPASGYVIEAEMDPGLGVLSRLLVLNGTLKTGDIVLAGKGFGHVRSMRDDRGRSVSEAAPASPVEVAGLDEIPEAGDKFYVVDDIDRARTVAEYHRQAARESQLAAPAKFDLEALLDRIGSGQANELALVIKADVQGSIEALTGALERLGTDEMKVKVLHAAAGGISTGDVTLAEASGAIIIGFNVVPDAPGRQLAQEKGVDIRLYRVIYDVIDDVRTALEKGLAPEIRQETIGRAEVRQVFKISRVGTIAGCFATDGVIQRGAKVRITRNQVVIEDGRTLESLKRFKEDTREVRAGFECGLKIAGYDDIKEGDELEFYRQVEVARRL